MMSAIQLPYSPDHVIVESRQVRSLLNLSIVRMTVKGKVINMTPDCARELGAELLEASMDQHESCQARIAHKPKPPLAKRAVQAIEHKINMALPLWMQIL